MIEKLHKNAFVEKYPSGHIQKIVRYVRNIYQIPFSHMKTYIDVSIQISHIVYMPQKIIIELETEYHIQCCSESGRHTCERKERM